jgi:hypothetical protein
MVETMISGQMESKQLKFPAIEKLTNIQLKGSLKWQKELLENRRFLWNFVEKYGKPKADRNGLLK